jgi:NADH-quinone oxidoreductase subunit G
VLRVLGNLLGVPGFAYDSSEQIRDEIVPPGSVFVSGLDNGVSGLAFTPAAERPVLQRIADVPIYFSDPLVRRAPALQQTADAVAPTARICAATLAQLGIAAGTPVRVSQGQGAALLTAHADETVPPDCVRVAAAHATTAPLGDMFGPINVERA